MAEVTKEEVVVKKNTYTYEYLLRQKLAIEKQRDEQLAQRQAELDEVNSLIAECDKLGMEKPVIEEVEDVGP